MEGGNADSKFKIAVSIVISRRVERETTFKRWKIASKRRKVDEKKTN